VAISMFVGATACTMAHDPTDNTWSCTSTLRNPHDEPIVFDSVTVAWRLDDRRQSPALQKKLQAGANPMTLGLVDQMKPQPPTWPTELGARDAFEMNIMLVEKRLEGGEIVGVDITATGQGTTTRKPAKVVVHGTFGSRRTWLTDEEIKRAGLPPPPAPLDMPGPPVDQPAKQ
jgi:hypothetical protein